MRKDWFKENLEGDYQIWTIVVLLSIISVLVIYSATGNLVLRTDSNMFKYLFKHTTLVLASLGVMWFVHRLDYHFLAKISTFSVIVSIFLLLYVYKFGLSVNGASRWILIPGIGMTFMPSDLAKLALITDLAAILAKNQHFSPEKYSWRTMINMLVRILCVVICISLTNASTAIILFATCFMLMGFGRVPIRFLVISIIFFILSSFILIKTGTGTRIETAKSRVQNYVNSITGNKKAGVDKDEDYQKERAYFAIANGGLFGKGPGKSQQRYFLSQADSDFVYAIIIEEGGMLAGLVILMLYIWLLFRGMKAVDNSGRAFGGLLSAGLTFSLVIQAMINMGVATGVGPVTGQPLPLISMGGSSLLFTGATVGIILSVSRDKLKRA